MHIIDLVRKSQSSITITAASLLGASLALSLIFFVVFHRETERRTLFFPLTVSPELHGEPRIVPRTGNLENDIRVLVDEMILGPFGIRHGRVVDRDTRLKAVLARQGTVYLDFSLELAVDTDDLLLSTDELIEVIDYTIKRNFRSIREVVITINGQQPFFPYFEIRRVDPSAVPG